MVDINRTDCLFRFTVEGVVFVAQTNREYWLRCLQHTVWNAMFPASTLYYRQGRTYEESEKYFCREAMRQCRVMLIHDKHCPPEILNAIRKVEE